MSLPVEKACLSAPAADSLYASSHVVPLHDKPFLLPNPANAALTQTLPITATAEERQKRHYY